MLIEISEQSKQAFEAACERLGLSKQLPDNSFMRPDLALNNTADYMLKVIIEAENDGVVNDITNHDVAKYEAWARADHGYKPGSNASGFRLDVAVCVNANSTVGARLSFADRAKACANFEKYRDLWEIIMLNVQ